MAHMWFGNYITCPWWDELWINESFATYFSFVGLEPSAKESLKWSPESGVGGWDLDHTLITGNTVSALNVDQSTSSNPIINIENRNPSDPVVKDHRNYGSSSIIYSKGGVVLSMVRCMVGDTAFFGGLNDYLTTYQYNNPSSENLFDSWDHFLTKQNITTKNPYIDQAQPLCGTIGINNNQATLPANKSVKNVLDTWTRQMGYPFIKVNSKVENGKTVLTLQQKRFLTNPAENEDEPESNLGYKWFVPLSIHTSAGYSHLWLDATHKPQDFELKESNFAFVNNQFRSLVRVLYEDEAKANVQEKLNEDTDSVDPKTRAQVVFDYFAFAENKALTGVSVTDALEITDFVRNDVDITVWELYQGGVKYMRNIMKYTEDKAVLDGYLNGIVEKFYNANDWSLDVSKIDDMQRTALSVSLVEACKYGNLDCLSNAKDVLDNFDPTDIDNLKNEPDRDQKLSAYCYGVQENSENYDKLWAYYQKEQSANEQSVLRSGMACAKDEATLKKYLNEALGESIRVQDKHYVFTGVSGSDYGRDVAWDFIREDKTWSWLYDMMENQSYRRVPSILSSATSTFSTAESKAEVEAFEKKITDAGQLGSLKSTFEGIYVKIDKNIKWRADNQQAIVDFINNRNEDGGNDENEDSGASQLKASLAFIAALLVLS